MVWENSSLKCEWIDRRHPDGPPVDSNVIPHAGGGTFERITVPTHDESKDRVYLFTAPSTERFMYWMQDADTSQDDELVSQVNAYLMNPGDAAPEGESGELSDSSPLLGDHGGGGAGGDAVSAARNGQVDALSNILENLGMPQQASSAQGSSDDAAATASSGAGTTGQLTLADLQGAMAGLATASPPPPPAARSVGPPLNEVVTPAAITELLQHPDVRARLMQLLPEDQQSEQYLEENLRSPQIQSTLRVLTQILLPDDAGSLEGYHSMIANFQLNAADGEQTLTTTNNPIQAFLDCIVASVQKEEEKGEESKEEDDDDAMQE
jgi:26S proteasome regulatory subunit N13